MSREASLTLTLTAATFIAGAYHSHLPGIYEARQMSEDHDFRATEVSLLVLAAGLGAVLAGEARSALPLVGTFGMALAYTVYYEWAIRANG